MVFSKKNCLCLLILLVCLSCNQASLFGHDARPHNRTLFALLTGSKEPRLWFNIEESITSSLIQARRVREQSKILIAAQAPILTAAAQAQSDLERALQGLRSATKKCVDKGLQVEIPFDATSFEKQQKETARHHDRLAAGIKQQYTTSIKPEKPPAGILKRSREDSIKEPSVKPEPISLSKRACKPLVPLFAEGKLDASASVVCGRSGDGLCWKFNGEEESGRESLDGLGGRAPRKTTV